MLDHILYSSAALIALMAPVGELPIFLSVMEGRSAAEHRKAALKVAFGALAVLLASALAGTGVLEVFGVSLPAFRAAGGLVVILIGLQMLQGQVSPVLTDQGTQAHPDDQLWVPLVMPLIAGPATIITVITLSIRETARPMLLPIGTIVAIFIATSMVLIILLFAIPLSRAVKPRVARVFERFFGLVLVAIGFQMGLTGIQEFFSV